MAFTFVYVCVYVTGSCSDQPHEEEQADSSSTEGVSETTTGGDDSAEDDYTPSPKKTPKKTGV